MKTFAIVNRKGGVGKTTTAVNLAYVLATSCRLRVLLVDADGQANATQILLPPGEYAGLGALLRGLSICYDELVEQTDVPGLDVLPASADLWALDLEADKGAHTYSAVMNMRDALEEDGAYDVMVIDCPPNLSAACVSAILASDAVIIPVLSDACSSTGVADLEEYYATLFEVYRDYIDAAYQLGYCMEHSKVLWPEQLYTAHDKLTAELAARYTEPQGKRVAADGKSRKEKYEFELDGLRIIFPLTAQAIKREGKALDHCVGGYAERHIRGVLTILFLRRSEAAGVPYVTIEMNGNQIQQIHGYHNDTLPGSPKPREVHKEFLDTWLRWLRAGSKRNEDGTPKLPQRAVRKKQGVGAA